MYILNKKEDEFSEQIKISQLQTQSQYQQQQLEIEQYKLINEELKEELDRIKNQVNDLDNQSSTGYKDSIRLGGFMGGVNLNSLSKSEITPMGYQNQQKVKFSEYQSINTSNRSRNDTNRLYKKLTQMGGVAASIMSVKRDYTSLYNTANSKQISETQHSVDEDDTNLNKNSLKNQLQKTQQIKNSSQNQSYQSDDDYNQYDYQNLEQQYKQIDYNQQQDDDDVYRQIKQELIDQDQMDKQNQHNNDQNVSQN
ncbi:hypothetical protein PPERSA_12413 [Pseudocohnilembus persalinus]|uniref:Uncharacterized protein n=1 Tax=Pseudocohnilembus persalinus TaxID=266149 RepID=A0A0V0QNW2_PSEPJ|nr:hypothetical protein PPERSA_12413 [Pseudocohnilembus persalinus]|eukprot:KRX03966.1 hypothetical protein PPERSA_12413 [Pseudocohnilembus persalinus]